ncbi:MAG: hypothetical protein LBR40_06250 [Bacilli bacterium]|jgi:hypothetical protein|nr:hypothetical protein [Bacilli bacterium]
MKLKNINTILFLLLVSILFVGCQTNKFKEYEPFTSEISKNDFILKNYQYLDECKNYQDYALVGNGMYHCKNNNINIEMNAYDNNIGLHLIDLTYDSNVNNKTILNEINKIYKSNNLKAMNEKQLNELYKDGHKRIFNEMEIYYSYDKDIKQNVISITGYKVSNIYLESKYIN